MDTAAPNVSDHPWMEHKETGHRAQLPDLPYWRANGWDPCEGPHPEPNLTRDPLLHDPEPEPEPDVKKPVAHKASKSASTKDGEK